MLCGAMGLVTSALDGQVGAAGSTSALFYSPVLPKNQTSPNATGTLGILNVNGPTVAATNPFFEALGTNGRSCATCHQPENAMSISAFSVQLRYLLSGGKDPLFAAFDGANCPDAVSSTALPFAIGDPNNPHSLLLNRALIRIGLPWPPKGVTPEFTIAGVYDPTHCELSPTYGIFSAQPTVSVYRRSLMAANLKFVTTVGPGAAAPEQVLPVDSYGQPESGNIMYDGREATLQSQAGDAIMGHAQAVALPSAAVIQQIVDFEKGIYVAQNFDAQALSLTDLGASGGPAALSAATAGLTAAPNTFSEYAGWANLPWYDPQAGQRESVARGEAIFNSRTFIVSNVAGINDLAGTNSLSASCALCHANTNDGNDVHPQAEINEGTTGGAFALPANDLPTFKLVCSAGKTTPFDGATVVVRDPGKALITGKCADIGKVKSAQLRGLAARAPYFHDGSAATLQDVVNFYNKRFNINFTAQEEADLVNFLRTL